MNDARLESSRLADLLRRERFALAEFLLALAAFDRSEGWKALGYASLFNYLHQDLALSKGAAFYRMTAARLIQAHPEIVEPLREGKLCLTSIVELSKVLTAENLPEVLPRFFQVSKREAQAVRAELRPADVVPRRVVVTAVRSMPLAASAVANDLGQPVHLANQIPDPGQSVHPEPGGDDSVLTSLPPVARRMTVEPKTADESRLHLTVPRSLLRKLAQARDALSHSHPGASEDQILEVGLDLIIERHAKRRGLVKNPRKSPPQPKAAEPAPSSPSKRKREHVPAHVMRAVWERDQGKCQWPIEGGGTCGSTHQVELDHIDPVGKGGITSFERCRLLCRPHQDVAARQAYGDEWMEKFARNRSPRSGTVREPEAGYVAASGCGAPPIRRGRASPAPVRVSGGPAARRRFRHSAPVRRPSS